MCGARSVWSKECVEQGVCGEGRVWSEEFVEQGVCGARSVE